MIFLKFSYEPGVFGEQICDSSSTNFHLKKWIIFRLVQRVSCREEAVYPAKRELLYRMLFILECHLLECFDSTGSINTNTECGCMYITEMYLKIQVIIVTEVFKF